MYITWLSASGERLGGVLDEGDFYVSAFTRVRAPCPLLSGIDFYRTTRITPTQGLSAEFRAVRSSLSDPAMSEYFSRLIGLVEAAILVPDSYLLFDGD